MDTSFYYDQLIGQMFTGKYVGIEFTRAGESRAVFEVNEQGNGNIKHIFERIRQSKGRVSLPFNSINFVDCSEYSETICNG